MRCIVRQGASRRERGTCASTAKLSSFGVLVSPPASGDAALASYWQALRLFPVLPRSAAAVVSEKLYSCSCIAAGLLGWCRLTPPPSHPPTPQPIPKCPVARKRVVGPLVAPADAFQRGALGARPFPRMAAGSCGSICRNMAAATHAGATTTKHMRQSSAAETWRGSLMSRAPISRVPPRPRCWHLPCTFPSLASQPDICFRGHQLPPLALYSQ